MAVMDTLSYVALSLDNAAYQILPAAQLSAPEDLNVIPVFMVGNASFEALNWMRGLSAPSVPMSGPIHNSWFTTDVLRRMFTVQSSGKGGRDGSSGFLQPLNAATIGTAAQGIAYFIGNGGGADSIRGCFSAVYAAGLTLTGGGRGTPVTAQIGFLPCGTRLAGASGSPRGNGTMPTVGGSPNLDLSPITTGAAGYFMSENVVFSNSMSDVINWTLVISNSMVPDLAVQGTLATDLSLGIYPANYLSGPIGFGLTITQRAGATIRDNVDPENLTGLSITLNSSVLHGGSPTTVTFVLTALDPKRMSTVRYLDTHVIRTYTGMATISGSTVTSKLVINT